MDIDIQKNWTKYDLFIFECEKQLDSKILKI